MLAMLGAVAFEIAPLNTHAIDRSTGATFAEKSVMGRRPPLEWVGEAPETFTLAGRLFPHKFGGLSSMDALHSQRQAGRALPFMRGDGRALGWFVIEQITERSSYLGPDGVGKVIEFDISLRRSDPPGATNIFSILSGLIG